MGMGSIWHWLVILVIILLLFGTKRLRGLGSDLGSAIKGFRETVRDDEDKEPNQSKPTKLEHAETDRVIDGEVANRDKTKV